MPFKIPDKLPAVKLLKQENIFVMPDSQAIHQDIRPLKLAILNLMPLKIITETDLLRVLSNNPLQIEVDFLSLSTHTPKNTSQEHMQAFYKSFQSVQESKYDGFIVTGAPVEKLEYEQVRYWSELTEIFDWARENVTSSLFICWASQAALYHYYGIPKYPLKEKQSGIFEHKHSSHQLPLFRGFDDLFYAPHSRYTEVRAADIRKHRELKIISESEKAGVYIVKGNRGRQLYVSGHPEYAPETLNEEYRRDLKKGLNIQTPANYYRDNNPDNEFVVRWRGHANLLFSNWLNYYVYQASPYDLSQDPTSQSA